MSSCRPANFASCSLAETEARAAELQEQLADIRTKLDEAQAEQLENTRAIMKAQKNAERYLNKRQTLTMRKEEHTNAIRDLGVLPEEAFTKYVAVRPEKVCRLCSSMNGAHGR